MKRFTISAGPDVAVTEVIETETGIRRSLVFEGDDIEVRDEYHSMHELYEHRMALNIALFNVIEYVGEPGVPPFVMKSKLHHDGTMFEGYFIVMMITNLGQVSYHYKLKHWDKFKIEEVERTPEWDGHSSLDVLERLAKL